MDNAELLLKLYNELDTLLREKYHNSNMSNSAMMRFINELNASSVTEIREIADELNMIRVLRNTLIHELDMNSRKLISINDETIAFLKYVIARVRNPHTADVVMIPLNKLLAIHHDSQTSIYEYMDEMRKKGFSQTPVLDSNNSVLGVFSPNTLFAFMHDNPEEDLRKLTINDLKEYTPLDRHFSETYLFVDIEKDYDELTMIFLNALSSNKKPALLFVTKHGKTNEPLLGIITLLDLIKNGE